jgi:formylglycine-generating enzyme required for sulfatase activity
MTPTQLSSTPYKFSIINYQFSIILCVFLLLIPPALAAQKVALIIGNSQYKADPLPNPVNDAADMAGMLQKLGFEVILEKDADKNAMVGALRTFHKKLGASDIGLFYYAGHGMQISGNNYLIPVRHAIAEEFEVESEAIGANRILSAMESAGNPLNIVILDACRNNPFQSFRGAQKGLAEMRAPRGTIISYATSPGSLAEDGQGRNGTYTQALLKNFQVPGLDVQKMFNRTGLDVMENTGGRQMPWVSSTPLPDFYLAGGAPEDRYQLPVQPEKVTTAPAVKTPEDNVSAQTAEKTEKKAVSAPATEVFPDKVPPSNPKAGDVWTEPVSGMVFVWVPGGCYKMGCGIWSNDCYDNETPVHKVCLDGFWIGKYEVTQGQWLQIMGSNPSTFKAGDDFPVETVSWYDAKTYIEKLNRQSGRTFALPTEAQWEYAARSGGRQEKFAGNNQAGSVAWYAGNSGGKTRRVGTKSPNGLGVHDMSGNVWEWCEDVYDKYAYSKHGRNNPVITSGETGRVFRGGSWDADLRYIRSTIRGKFQAKIKYDRLGFRVAFNQDSKSSHR